MKLSILIAAAVSLTALAPALADEYTSSTTTIQQSDIVPIFPETRIIETQPVFIEPVNNTIVIKKKHHHLIKVGPVKVF